VSSAVTSGLFGLGGVILGVVLNTVGTTRTRKQVSAEERERERERRQRELLVAERLDEALVYASAALDRSVTRGRGVPTLEDHYRDAYDHWAEAWVAYSSRLRQPELLRRYDAIGLLLMEVVHRDRTSVEIPRHVVARAIANARVTLAYFMRGEEQLPPATFPEPDELRRLLGEGDGQIDPLHPLKHWLSQHPMPEFHPS
jgi:hypothetical protein